MKLDETLIRERYANLCALFPWEEVARIFAEKGWVYGFGSGEFVPGAAGLRETADELFRGALKAVLESGSKSWMCSGRFLVKVDVDSVEISAQAIREPSCEHAECDFLDAIACSRKFFINRKECDCRCHAQQEEKA